MTTPSNSLRTHMSVSALERKLQFELPAAHGVGLDGILPSAIDDWPDSRRRELASFTATAVREDSYRFTSYREGLASRGRDRAPRVFAIPTVRDRLVLSALKSTLHDIYGYSGPEPPQHKMVKVIDAISSGAYTHYLKVDVQEYFPSIRHQILLSKLAQQTKSKKFLDLLERSLRNSTVAFGQKSRGLDSRPDGIPLGLSISPALAEIYLAEFDRKFATSGRAYFRYVDDILILSPNELHPFAAVKAELELLGLHTHPMGTPGKCEYGDIAGGFDFLGYRINHNTVRVTKAGVLKIERDVASLVAQISRETRGRTPNAAEVRRLHWRLNLLIGGCVINGEARGWIRYYNRMTDITALAHLDALVDNLMRRYRVSAPKPVKQFRLAYWASRNNDRFRRYAFDLDRTTASEARRHLVEHESWRESEAAALTDNQAKAAFRRLVQRHVIDLERDLEPAS